MNALPFEKWDATGNDFIIVDLTELSIGEEEFSPSRVQFLCDRNHGIGADGVVLLTLGSLNHRVTIINSDGSVAAMCGNAMRCIGIKLAQSGLGHEYRVQVGDRLVTTRMLGPERASVVMGEVGDVADDHLAYSSLPSLDQKLGGKGYLLSFGNPHYVVPMLEIPVDWVDRGRKVQTLANDLLGLGGVNCGFLSQEPDTKGRFRLRVYERGAGATKSCGSGACAASAILEHRLGMPQPHVLELPGGELRIERLGTHYVLSGEARKEYSGQWPWNTVID